MPNKYYDSEGNAWTQRQIDTKRSWAYRNKQQDNPEYWCAGCGARCQCNAHILAQSRCKHLGKTELIWNPDNFFASCYKCNLAIENPKGQAWKNLKNIDSCLSFIKKHDPELYLKFTLSI